MGLYLAELAPISKWTKDPVERGHLLVLYKKELRWAKPCMRYGAFEVPDKAWVERNYKKFKVWIDFEDQRVGSSIQESLIWVGFLPVGDDNYPEPAAKVSDNYPDVATEEIGSWRVVRVSIAGKEAFQIYKKGADGKFVPVMILDKDGGVISNADKTISFYLPIGTTNKSISLSLNAKASKPSFQLLMPSGMAILATDEGSIVLKNADGSQYLEIGTEVLASGAFKVNGSAIIGDPVAAQPLIIDTLFATWWNATVVPAGASHLPVPLTIPPYVPMSLASKFLKAL